jgi:hypothetical protein
VGATATVSPDQYLFVQVGRDLVKREPSRGDVVVSGVGAGVAASEQQCGGLARPARAMVDERGHRVKPKGVFPRRRGLFLVRMRNHDGRVPILLNTVSAVATVDPTLVKSARSLGLSAPRVFQKVILPASVPTIFTGIRLAGAHSILVLVAAEMVGAKEGLGFLISASQQNFAIKEMYAGIVTISVIGVVLNQLLIASERRLTRWRPPATGR